MGQGVIYYRQLVLDHRLAKKFIEYPQIILYNNGDTVFPVSVAGQQIKTPEFEKLSFLRKIRIQRSLSRSNVG